MTSEREPVQRERRAIDGLDWSVPAEPGTPPAHTGPVAPASVAARSGRPVRAGWVVVLALLAGLTGGLVSGLLIGVVFDDSGGTPVDGGTGNGLTVEHTSAVRDAAAKARASVVRIESTRRTTSGVVQDVGSGVVLDTDGHILTNAHVVLNTETLTVFLADGSERKAIMIGHDYPFTDVAVLQIGPGGLEPVEIGDSAALALGETVLAIGNPLSDFEGSVSVGVVSGLNRRRTFDGVVQPDLIQTDAAVNQGNSGGALVNLRGAFVGMPTSVVRESRSGQPVEGIAFALPSARVLEIARGIIAESGAYPRPTLAIEHLDLTPDVLARAPRLAVEEGALVTQVIPGGTADAAGIQPGDVITGIGGEQVDRQNLLLNVLLRFNPDDTVRVVLNRDGRIIEVEVRLGKRG